MSKKIGNELYCRDCEYETRTEARLDECPKCGSPSVFNSSFITCDCGTTVYLSRFTNECEMCGKLYNGFGQELAPVNEWDEETRYGTFGPQNYCDY